MMLCIYIYIGVNGSAHIKLHRYIYFVCYMYILLFMHFTRITLPTICNTKLSNSGYEPAYTPCIIIIPNNRVLEMCTNSIIVILIQYNILYYMNRAYNIYIIAYIYNCNIVILLLSMVNNSI